MSKASQSNGPILQIRGSAAGLDPPSLSLEAGGSCVVVGSEGAGKSTLVEAIVAGRGRPALRLTLFGEPCEGLGVSARVRLRRRLGIIFQDLRLVDQLSAFDNVALAARAVGRPFAEYRAPAAELLAWVGLARRANNLAGEFTVEGRRRLALARALINSPELLVADEPTWGLGHKARNSLLQLIGEVHEAGTAVLLATRDAAIAQTSGGAVLMMRKSP